MRLVEIVDVEDQIALGRSVGAKVGEVSVATQLNHDGGMGDGREVARHDDGGPTDRLNGDSSILA